MLNRRKGSRYLLYISVDSSQDTSFTLLSKERIIKNCIGYSPSNLAMKLNGTKSMDFFEYQKHPYESLVLFSKRL